MLQMTRALSLADVAPRRGALLAPLLVGVLLAGLPPRRWAHPRRAGRHHRRGRGTTAPPGEAPARLQRTQTHLAPRRCRPGVFPGYRGLDQEIQDLKRMWSIQQTVILEENAVPPNTQVRVFAVNVTFFRTRFGAAETIARRINYL